jgi:hypothetical protein
VTPENAISVSLNSFSNKLYTQPDVFFQALITNITERRLIIEKLSFQPAVVTTVKKPKGSINSISGNPVIPPKIKLNAIMPSSSEISINSNETFSAIVSLSKEMDLLVY